MVNRFTGAARCPLPRIVQPARDALAARDQLVVDPVKVFAFRCAALYQEANWLQQAASQGAWSSAKAIEATAKAGSTAESTTSTSKGGQAGAHIDVDAGFGGGSKTQKGVNF